MTDIGAWLRGLGLEQYEAAFRENAVDASVLPELTAEDLREIGVAAVGHRRRLLTAIAALRGLASSEASPPAATPPRNAGEGHASDGGGAERRQVTVLFCDLAGSTALSARIDPEDLREIIAVYHRTVVKAVQEKGGYVAKFLGDGVLAYFGWPRAHEDDAERAVGAGLNAVGAIARLEMAVGPLAARVGIATGPVVVGDVHGEGTAREHGIAGETPNLAARLQGIAGPGAVVLDEATRRLTGTLFECADLGEVRLTGLPNPVRAWRALAEGTVESRFEALRAGHATPLVGREEELELLLRRWDQARAGEGRVVLLRGEAGIGKSRLTVALREALAAREHDELVLYCSPQHTDSALRPIIARLERVAGLVPSDVPEARLAKLEALLTPLAPPAEDVALIAELLSVPTLGRWPELDLPPQRRRELLLQALLRRIRELAARRPLLVVVEDAHWLDPTTRELLDLLVAEVPRMALLLVVTHRPEFDAAAWLGLALVTLMQLNRLGRAEHATLLRRVAGDKALPPEVATEVLARTDGVPLFVEEVGRAVLESGLLREEADRWVLNGPLTSMAVPSSLQASLVARLDRLSSVREAVQAGAVLGREFAHDIVAVVSGLSEERLRDALGQLEAAGLLQRRGEPPGAVYAFRHTLIQDAAQGTLLRERKRDLHRRAAEAFERLRPEVEDREPEMLAHHWAEAGVARKAFELYRRAGERSADHSFLREAHAHLAAALDLLVGLPRDMWRDRTELELQIRLAGATSWVKGQAAPATGQVYTRARQLCHQLGETKQLIPVLAGLAVHHTNRAEPETACLVAEEMLHLALS
ncbi:MAG TPA: AAA family ATPase, partial [Acetobacteraceae bacterium]|nr:AAA family ATPase [Acetobacteraceae bacterium]